MAQTINIAKTIIRIAAAAVVSMAVFGISVNAHAQTTLLRISNQLPTTAAVTRGLEFWKSKVEALTNGRIRAGQLS
jgi:TRAP-type C4-dicarboxylate transport system substrate-binding protein